MKASVIKALATFALSLSVTATAEGADLSGALGATSQSGLTARMALGLNWDESWFASPTGRLTGYWDLGYTYWQAGDRAGGRHSLSFAPVFVYELGQGLIRPYIEAGVGIAVFSGSQAGDQNLGSAFNFEDRLGVGLKFGQSQRVGLRVIHYSNAGIAQPNDGIESYSLFYAHTL